MDRDAVKKYCLGLAGATSDFPFDQTTEVFRILGKIFALMPWDSEIPWVNLKCDPPLARDLRDRYDAVNPGYHMNKEHWNTVTLDGSLETKMITGLIDHSYELILKSLPKKRKKELGLEDK